MAKIVLDLQRFQVPYNLLEVPELQRFLASAFNSTKCSGRDGSALYRLSMKIEPRQVEELGKLSIGEFGWK